MPLLALELARVPGPRLPLLLKWLLCLPLLARLDTLLLWA
jgi:hypothetical protein